MIQSLTFMNFKAIREMHISLDRFTVFVGANSSGKSTVLDGLHYLSQLGRKETSDLFRGPRDFLFLYRRNGVGELKLEQHSSEGSVRLRVTPPVVFPTNLLHPGSSKSLLNKWESVVECQDPQATAEWTPVTLPTKWQHLFRSAVYLRLDAAKMAKPSYSEHRLPRVEHDGDGLPSVLAYMALNQPDDFAAMQEAFKEVIPAVKRVRFDRAPVGRTERETVTIGEDTLSRRVQREYLGQSGF